MEFKNALYTYNGVLFSPLKISVTIKMKTEGFEVNEVSQTQKDKPTSSHSNKKYKSIKLLEMERGYQRLERGMGPISIVYCKKKKIW